MPASTSPSSSARLRAVDGVDARVHCFGARARRGRHHRVRRPGRSSPTPTPPSARSGVDLEMVGGCAGTDVVHSHTWYANMAGHLAKLLHGVPHVVTAHSLEPMRPWKAEQLGGGYAVSSWVERTAYDAADAVIAVSAAMRDDVLRSYPDVDPARVHVVHNGIDTDDWQPVREPAAGARARASTPTGRASSSSAGSPARRACRCSCGPRPSSRPRCSWCCAPGRPDTKEIEAEVRGLVDGLAAERDGVVWIAEMLPRPDVVALLTAATVFACPSIYEPLGIVNLEAMACETAVVATATGGIPEVVVHGETGWLVPDRAGHRRHRDTAGPRALRRRPRRRARRRRQRPRAGPRARARRPPPGPGVVQLAGDRRADAGGLPLTARGLAPRAPGGRCGSDAPPRVGPVLLDREHALRHRGDGAVALRRTTHPADAAVGRLLLRP